MPLGVTVPLPETVALRLSDCDGVGVDEAVRDALAVPVPEGVAVDDGLRVGLAVRDALAVVPWLPLCVTLDVIDWDSLGVCVDDCVRVTLLVCEGVADTDPLCDCDRDCVPDGVVVKLPVFD